MICKLNQKDIVITSSYLRPDKIYDETYKMINVNSCAWCVHKSSCMFADMRNNSTRMCFRFHINSRSYNSDVINLYINLKHRNNYIECVLEGKII